MTNRNQTDTNDIATTETKYQTDVYSFGKYQYLIKFCEDHSQVTDKIPRKYKKFGTEIPNTDLVLVFSSYTKFFITD